MTILGTGTGLIAAWLLGASAGALGLLALLWLRMRRVRLQVEAEYLSAVAEFAQSEELREGRAHFAGIRGEAPRRLLAALAGPGVPVGPLSWRSSGRLRYDRDRVVSAETFLLPGRWWAQIRRVRLRRFGWVDEIHRVGGAGASSSFWWLGLFRVRRPGFGPSDIALTAQALGDGVLAPWSWFAGGAVDWDVTDDGGDWEGALPGTGQRVTLHLDRMGRPQWVRIAAADTGDTVQVEFGDWHWSDGALVPSHLRVIEGVDTVNAYVHLDAQIHQIRRAPGPVRTPAG